MSVVAQAGVVLAALVVSALAGWLLTALVLRLADRSRPTRPNSVPSTDTTVSATDATETVTDAAASGTDAGTAAPASRADGPDGAGARDRLRGGTWIGVLERLAVTGTLLAGEPGGVAVVVAVKGLGRYPELRSGDSPGVSERFVIGTLTSLLWSAAVGLVGRWLLTR